MRANGRCARSSICVAVLVFGFAALAAAKDGRDFMGYYDISNVSGTGNTVQVTIQLRIFNYSEGDIQRGAVALYNSEPSPAPLGGFRAIKLFRKHHDVDLAQQFTIPQREFDRWQHGGKPALFFLYKNAKGQTLKRNIELVRRPLAPVQPGL